MASEGSPSSSPGEPRLPPGRFVELPGRGKTFVRKAEGPPGAPTVVLLHGWTVTADLNWFPSYEPLSRRFDVVALDQRGHGKGVRSRRPFRLEDCADDVAALAETIGTKRLIAVGYSMGGPVAQLLWRRHPELVDGLVMCATAARLMDHDLANLAFLSGLFGLSVASRLAPPPAVRALAARLVAARLDGSPRRDWALAELVANDPTAMIEAGIALRTYDATSWVGEIDVPAAVVVTTRDPVVSPARQVALAEAVPGATLHEVEGDHGACVEQASRFVPALLDATASVSRRAAARGGARR